ncbi:hypothetical protein GCM10010191_27700 [Actinomadura vinacea]|uniref:Uncharacterized protein n=1 Tax=Actinomadura vinacea TaxID=115336 RepID=A0ABP5W0R9_9ACTN
MQAQHRWFRFGGRAGQATARWAAARPRPGKSDAGVRGPSDPPGPVPRGEADRAGPGVGGSTRTAEPHAVQARSGQSAPCPSRQGGCSNSRSSPQVEQYKGDLPRL